MKHNVKRKRNFKQWLGTICILLCSVLTFSGCAIADNFNKGTITGEDSEGLLRITSPWFHFDSSTGLFSWAFSPYSYSGKNESELINGNNRYTYLVNSDQTTTGTTSTVIFTGDPNSIQYLENNSAYYLTSYTDTVTGTQFLKATKAEGTYAEELKKVEEYVKDPSNTQTSQEINRLMLWNQATGYYCLQHQTQMSFDGDAVITAQDIAVNSYGFSFVSQTQNYTTYYNVDMQNGKETYVNANITYINPNEQENLATYYALANTSNYTNNGFLTITSSSDPAFTALTAENASALLLKQIRYLAGFNEISPTLISIEVSEDVSVLSKQQVLTFTVTQYTTPEKTTVSKTVTLTFASQNNGITYATTYTATDGKTYTATLTKASTTVQEGWINVADTNTYKALDKNSIASDKQSIILDNVLNVAKYNNPSNPSLTEKFAKYSFVFLGNQTTAPSFIALNNSLIACSITEAGELVLGDYTIYTTSSTFAYTSVYVPTEENPSTLLEIVPTASLGLLTLEKGKTYTLTINDDMSFTVAETNQKFGDELSVLLGQLLAKKNLTDTVTTQIYFTWNNETLTQRAQNLRLNAVDASVDNNDITAQYAEGKYILQGERNSNDTYTPTKTEYVKAFAFTYQIIEGGASNIVNIVSSDVVTKIEYTHTGAAVDSIANYFTKAELETILKTNIANSKLNNKAENARVLPTVSIMQDGVEYIYYPVVVPSVSGDETAGANTNYQLTIDDNRTVNIWFLQETTVEINGVYHTVLRKAPEEHIRARVKESISTNNTTESGEAIDLSAIIANNMYIEFSPRLTNGTTTRNLKVRALALADTNRANSAYSNNIKYNAYKMSFTTYSPNSITIDYGELMYNSNKYYFYNVNTTYDKVLGKEMVTQLTGFFAEGTLVSVSRTTPEEGQEARDEAFADISLTATSSLNDYLRKEYSYALQSWSVNQKALNTFACSSTLSFNLTGTMSQQNIYNVMLSKSLLNDNVFFGVGSTVKGASVVVADSTQPYYVAVNNKATDPSTVYVKSSSNVQGCNFYANYTKIDNFSITGTVYNSEDLMGGASSSFSGQISYGLTDSASSFNLNSLNEFSVVGLSLEQSLYFKGVYDNTVSAPSSTGYGYYFFLSDYVTALKNNVYQLPVIRSMGSISVFGDMESTGLIATKFHESTNLIVNVVAPSENDPLPNGTSYEVIKSITSSVDQNGYVVTTVIISVLVPDDSMLLAYNIDTNSVGYSSTRSFADASGNVVVLNEKSGTIYGAVLTLADGTTEVLKPTQINLTTAENDGLDTLTIKHSTIAESVVFTEVVTLVSDSAIVAPVYNTGIQTKYENSGSNPLPIYVTYDVQSANGWYFYTAPIGEPSTTNGSIDFYAEELALSYTSDCENALKNLTQYIVSGTVLEQYLNTTLSETATDPEKIKHAYANLLGTRIVSNKYYFVKPLEEAKDALLSQQVQSGNVSKTISILTLYTQDGKLFNGSYKTEELLDGTYTFTVTDASSSVLYTHVNNTDTNYPNGTIAVNGDKVVNLASLGYATSANGTAVKVSSLANASVSASFIDVTTGVSYTSEFVNITKNTNFANLTFTFTRYITDENGNYIVDEETNEYKKVTFTKSINDPELDITFTYLNEDTTTPTSLSNAWVFVPSSQINDISTYIANNKNNLTYVSTSITYTSTLRYYYTTTDENGALVENDLVAKFETQTMEVEEGVITRKAVLKEDATDIVVLGKHYIDGVISRYNPTFSAWATTSEEDPETSDTSASIIGNKNGYYYLDYSSANSLSKGFPGVKYLDGAPYPNPVLIFNVRHKINEHSEISVGLLVKNVYQAELLGSFADTSTSSTFMDFTSFAFRSSEENLENSELLHSHAYVLRLQPSGFDYLYTNIHYRDESNQQLNTYLPLKIADIKVVETDNGTYKLVYTGSALAPNGSYYYHEGDTVAVRWYNHTNNIYEEKTEFTAEEFEQLIIWSTSSNLIDNVGYQDIHTYYEGSDGRIHFTSDGATDAPCYGLANISSGDIHNGNQYDYSEVLFAGTATAFRSTVPGLIGEINSASSGTMFDPNIWGYFINNMYPITISANSDTVNSPYFITNQETVVFVANPYLQFESSSSTSGVASQGVLYRFKEWRIFERYNESIMYRAYNQEAAYSRYLNNAIFTFAPSTSGRYLILPVYERVYQVNVGTGVVGNTENTATNNTTFTPNQGGSITITYDHTTGTYVSLDNVTREEIQRKLFFIEYLEAFKQANISTIFTQTFLFAKINASGDASTIDLMLDTSMANYFTYFAYNSTTQAYNFMFNGQDTVQSSLTVPNGENSSVTFYAYELILDDYGTYYIQYKDQQIALTASNIQTIYKYNEQGKVVAETEFPTFDDEILPYIYNYVNVGFTATSTVYGNSQKTIYFTVENNQLYPTTVSFNDGGEATFTKNTNPVANLFTKNFNFVGTYLSTDYITFNNGWNMPDVNDYESEEDPAYEDALHKYQTQVIWGTTYFDRDTYIQITARANLGYRLYNFYFATYNATLQRYVFDASMTINDYLVANAATLSYADQIVPAYYNSHNNTYYFDSNYQNPVPDSYLDAVRGSFIQSIGASGEYYYTQVYFNAQNNKYYFDSAYTILAKVNGAEVTESMVTEKTYLSAITPVVEYDTDNTTVLSTRYYLNGVEVYLNPEDGNYYREISDGNYTVHDGTLTIKTLHENVAIVATFKEVYQQFIFAEPESASGIKITDIYYYNAYGEDKNNRTDIYANVQVDEVVNGFSSSAISIPLKAQAGATTEESTTLYNLLASGKYTNKLFLNSTGGLVSDYAFGSYSGKHISSEQAQQQGITLSNMNMYFDQDCEIFVVVRVNAENKLETHSMGTNPNYVIECVVEPTETYLTQLQSGNANAREKYTYYILRYTYNRAPSNPYYSYITHPYRGPNIASDMANATIEEQKQYYTDYEKKILKPFIEAGSSNFINLSTIELFNITVTTSIVGTQSEHDILLGDFFAVAGYGTTQLLGFNPPTTVDSFTEYVNAYGQEFSTYLQSFDIIGGNASSINIYKATTNAEQITEYVVNNNYTYTWQNLVAARDTGIIFSTFNTGENTGASYDADLGLFIQQDEQGNKHYYRFMGWYERSLLHAYTDANGNRVEIWSDYNYQESAGGSAEYSHMIIADADKQIMAVYKEVVPFAFTYNPQEARVNFSYTTDSLGNAFKVTEENGFTTLSGYVDVDFSMDVQIVPVGGYRYDNISLHVNGAHITTWETYTRNNVTLDLTGKLANTNPKHMLKETLTLKTTSKENGSIVHDGASNIELDGLYATNGPANFTLTMQEITPISIRTHGYKETHSITLTNNAGQTFALKGKTIVTNTLLDDTQNPVAYDAKTNTIAFYQDAGTENRYIYKISLNASEDETLNGYFVNNDTTNPYPTQNKNGSTYTLSPKTDIHKQGQLLYATVQGTTSLEFNFTDAFSKGYITKAVISITSGGGYLQNSVFVQEDIEFTDLTTPTGTYVFDNETHITIELYRKVSINDITIEVKWQINKTQNINGKHYALTGYENVGSGTTNIENESVASLPSTITPIFMKSTPLMQTSTFAQMATPAWATFVTALASRSLSLANPTFTASLQNGEAVKGYFEKVSNNILRVTFTYATLTIAFDKNVIVTHEDGSVGYIPMENTYVTKATLETNEGYVFENTNGNFTQSTAKKNVYTLENVLFYQNGTYSDVFANLAFSLARTITVVANPSDLSSDIGIYTSANANNSVTQITYTGQAYLHLKVNLPENKKPYYTFEGWYIGNKLLSTSADFDITSVLSNYQTSITVEARFATFVSVNLALNFSGLPTNVQPTGTLFTINVQSGTVYLNNALLKLGVHEITLSYFTAYGSTLRFSSNAQFTIQGNNISYQDATYTFAGFTQNELLNGGSTEIDQGSFLVNTSSTTNVAKLTLNYVQNITFTLNKVMQDKTVITSTRAYFEAIITHSSFPHLAQYYQVFASGETIHTYYDANLTLSLYYDTSMFTYNVNHASNISNGFTFTEGNQEAISATYNKLTYNAKTLASASHHNFTFTFTTYAQMNFELQENVLLWQYYDATQEGWQNIPASGTLMVTNLSSVDIRLQLLHTQTITFVLDSITVNGLVLPVAEATITQDDNGNTYYEFRDIAVTTAHISAQVTPAYEITLQRYIDGMLQASTQLPLYIAHRHIQTETVPALTNAQGVYIAPTGSAVHIVAEQNNAYLFAGFTVYSMQGEVLDILPANTTDAYITFTPTEPCMVRAEYVSLYSIATFTETRGSFTNTQVGGSISVSSQELYNQATQNTPFTVAVQANAGFTTQAIVLTYVENGTTVTKIFTPETFANGEFTINNGNGTFDIPYSAEQITFTAIFAQQRNVTVTIQTINGANGTVTINGQTINSGETLTFTYNQALECIASADQGYVFAGWFLDEYTPISYNETLSMLATEVWLHNANQTREINMIAKFNTSIPSYNSHTSMSVAVLQADGSIAWQTNTLEWLTQNGNTYGYKEKQGYTFIGWYQEIRTNISNYLPVSAQSTYTLPVENKGEVLMVAMYAQNKQITQTYTYQTWQTTHTWESAVGYVTQVGNVQTDAGQQVQTNVTLPERTNTQLTITNANGIFENVTQTQGTNASITIIFTQTMYELTVEVYLPNGSLATQEQLTAWLLGNGSGTYAQNSNMFVGLTLEGTNYAIASITNNAGLQVGFQNTFTFTLTQHTTITYTLKNIPQVEKPENGTEIVDGAYHHYTFNAPAGYILSEVTIGETTYTLEQLKGLSGVQNLSFTYGYASFNASTNVAGTFNPTTMVTGVAFSISEEDFANVTASVTLQQILQINVSTSLQNDASAMYYIPYTSSLNLTPWLNQYPGVNFAVYVNGILQADSTNVTVEAYTYALQVYFEEITSSEYTIVLQDADGNTFPDGERLLMVNDETYANNGKITLSTGTFYNIGLINGYAQTYTLQSMKYTNGLGEVVTVKFTQAQNNTWSYPAEGIQAGSFITFTIAEQQNSFSIFIPIPWNELTQNEKITNAQTLAELLFANNNTDVLASIDEFTLTEQSNGVWLVATYPATLAGSLTLYPLQQSALEFLENRYTYVSTKTGENNVTDATDISIKMENMHQTYYINYTQEKAVYLASNRDKLNDEISITIQTNDNQYNNSISLAGFTFGEETARYYRFYIPANKVIHFTFFTDTDGNISDMSLFEIVMKNSSANIADFLDLYTSTERNIQKNKDAYHNIQIQLNNPEQTLHKRSATLTVQNATVLFLDFERMQESIPDGYFIHGGVGSVIKKDQDAVLNPNFSSTFNGGYYNFTTNGNYTVTQEKDSSYYIDTTTGLEKVEGSTNTYQPSSLNGGEVGVATNKTQTITFNAQVFGSTNTLVFKDTGETLTYAQQITLKQIDNKLYATRDGKNAEVVVKSSRSAINLETFKITANEQRLGEQNTTFTYQVNQTVKLTAYKQTNYRFVGFIAYMSNGTTVNLPYEQSMDNTSIVYTTTLTVVGSIEQIEILYEGQISQITLRQIEISQESFDPSATGYTLSYNGKTPTYKGSFESKEDILKAAVANKNTYIAGNYSSSFVGSIPDASMTALWTQILQNTFKTASNISPNTVFMAYYDGTSVNIYHFNTIMLNEEGIVDLQWIVVSYLVTESQTQNEDGSTKTTHTFDMMNSYLGYTKGSLLVRESVTLSAYAYQYGEHIGWSLPNGLTNDIYDEDTVVTAQSVQNPTITQALTNHISTNLGNVVTFTIPNSVTIFTYFTTMRYLVTVDFADMENVTTNTYDSNNTNYLVFDTSNETYQEFFDSYYDVFGDYRVRIENGNQIVNEELGIKAPSIAANTLQLVRQSWLDMSLSKQNKQLIMNEKFAEDYFGVRNQQFALRVPQCVTNTTNLPTVNGSALYTYDMIDWGMYGASKQLSNFLQYFTEDDEGNLKLKENLLTITYNHTKFTNYSLQITQNTSTENNVNVTGSIAIKFYIYANTGTGFGPLEIQGNPLLDSAYEIKNTVITYSDGSQKTFLGDNNTATGNVIVKNEEHNIAEKTSDTVKAVNLAAGFNQWIYSEMTYDANGNPTKVVEPENVTITFIQSAKSSNVNTSVNLGTSLYTYQLLGQVNGSNNMADYTLSGYATKYLKLLEHASKAQNQSNLYRLFGNDWKTAEKYGTLGVKNGEYYSNNSSIYSNYDITILKNAEYHAQTVRMWLDYYNAKGSNYYYTTLLFMQLYQIMLSTQLTDLYYQEGDDASAIVYSLKDNFADYIEDKLSNPLTNAEKTVQLSIDTSSLIVANDNPVYFTGTISVPNFYNISANVNVGNIEFYASQIISAQDNNDTAKLETLWKNLFSGTLEIPIVYINIQSLYGSYFTQDGGYDIYSNNELLRILLTMDNSITLFDQVIVNTAFNEQYQMQLNDPVANTEADRKDKWFPWWTIEEGVQYHPDDAEKAYSYYFPGSLEVQTTSQEQTLIIKSELSKDRENNEAIIENYTDSLRNAFAYAFPNSYALFKSSQADAERSTVDFTTKNTYCNSMITNFTLFNLKTITYDELFNGGGVGINISATCKIYQGGDEDTAYDDLCITKIYEYNPVPWDIYWVRVVTQVAEVIFDAVSIATGVGAVATAIKAATKAILKVAGKAIIKQIVKFAAKSMLAYTVARTVYSMAVKLPNPFTDPIADAKSKNPVYMDDIILIADKNGVPNYTV